MPKSKPTLTELITQGYSTYAHCPDHISAIRCYDKAKAEGLHPKIFEIMEHRRRQFYVLTKEDTMVVGTLRSDGTIVYEVHINQESLTSDCWLIQFSGLSACDTCEAKGTPDCGGGNTLKRLLKAVADKT